MKLTTYGRGGFTLIEIMVTVAIIGMLSAISVPSWVRSRERAQLNNIVNNLRMIESSKEQWALELKKGTGAVVTDTDLLAYLKNNVMPTPIASETYNINPVGTPADATLASKLGSVPAGGTIYLP